MKGMFSFISKTYNPIAMRCLHCCTYCWSEDLKKGRLRNCIRYSEVYNSVTGIKLIESELGKHFHKSQFVFVEDMGDLFGEWVPKEMITRVLQDMWAWKCKALLLTKNPGRYLEFQDILLPSWRIGVTIETNRSTAQFSDAPSTLARAKAMKKLKAADKFVCIEPIMDFDLPDMMAMIADIRPNIVAIGYDNYRKGLPEPPLWKTEELIKMIEFLDIKVEKKTLREPHGTKTSFKA